jgi:hypothetical protein
MTISNEHLAELLSGIARAQQAIVDAVERAEPGWRSTHLVPMLNVAANMRSPQPRMVDLASRILLRYQGKVPPDSALIVADLERLLALPAQSAAADPTAPAPVPPAVARALARAAAGGAAPVPVAPKPAPAAAADENLDFSKPS